MTQPEKDNRIVGRQGFGLVQVFTGNGKGKTTAALGEMIRAIGAGKKVGVVYFDKGGEHYSERAVLSRFSDQVIWIATGRDRIEASGRFDFSVTEEDKKEAAHGLLELEKMLTDDYDLVVADEINSTVTLGIVDEERVLDLIDEKSNKTEVVLTGRNAPDSFIKKAHLVTEMSLRKHYFYFGVKAREGIDF